MPTYDDVMRKKQVPSGRNIQRDLPHGLRVQLKTCCPFCEKEYPVYVIIRSATVSIAAPVIDRSGAFQTGA